MTTHTGRYAATIETRFWAKVDKHGPIPVARPDLGPCWLWTAATNGKSGYGIYRGGEGRDKGGSRPWVTAHRFAYELERGPISDGLEPDHLCRVRLCVHPAHLELVSHRTNTLRGESPAAQQARRTGSAMSWELVISGSPRTKKTHNRVVRAGQRLIVLPSKSWMDWVKAALIEYGVNGARATFYGFQPLTTTPVNCRALFYRDALRGDAVGYMQGLADLLEKRGVIANDAQICQWDGTRLLLDRANPRVEVELTALEDG